MFHPFVEKILFPNTITDCCDKPTHHNINQVTYSTVDISPLILITVYKDQVDTELAKKVS